MYRTSFAVSVSPASHVIDESLAQHPFVMSVGDGRALIRAALAERAAWDELKAKKKDDQAKREEQSRKDGKRDKDSSSSFRDSLKDVRDAKDKDSPSKKSDLGRSRDLRELSSSSSLSSKDNKDLITSSPISIKDSRSRDDKDSRDSSSLLGSSSLPSKDNKDLIVSPPSSSSSRDSRSRDDKDSRESSSSSSSKDSKRGDESPLTERERKRRDKRASQTLPLPERGRQRKQSLGTEPTSPSHGSGTTAPSGLTSISASALPPHMSSPSSSSSSGSPSSGRPRSGVRPSREETLESKLDLLVAMVSDMSSQLFTAQAQIADHQASLRTIAARLEQQPPQHGSVPTPATAPTPTSGANAKLVAATTTAATAATAAAAKPVIPSIATAVAASNSGLISPPPHVPRIGSGSSDGSHDDPNGDLEFPIIARSQSRSRPSTWVTPLDRLLGESGSDSDDEESSGPVLLPVERRASFTAVRHSSNDVFQVRRTPRAFALSAHMEEIARLRAELEESERRYRQLEVENNVLRQQMSRRPLMPQRTVSSYNSPLSTPMLTSAAPSTPAE